VSRAVPRLLYVFNDAGFFLSHRAPVAEAARKAGYEVHVATPAGAATEVIAGSFPHHPIALSRRGTGPLREAVSVLELARLYRRLRPELVEHATIKPVIYGGLAARVVRAPATVSWMTGLGFVFISTGVRARVARGVVSSAYRVALHRPRSRVIFENPDDRALFTGLHLVPADRAELIRGAGVDMSRFRPRPEPPGPPLVILASRMLRDKGVEEFVAAARLLRARGEPARFALVGDSDPGNPASIPEGRLRGWGESGVVEWWGQRSDMPEVFAAAHVVCLPSYREGLPKVLVEAAASGRAIVATDVPGCREIVRDGSNGVLVPPRDAPALAAAIARLLDDAPERARMGARGRELAEREFALELVVQQTLAVYRELTA
jgi:glycosyltransferase involved in cell wall biosynthesis